MCRRRQAAMARGTASSLESLFEPPASPVGPVADSRRTRGRARRSLASGRRRSRPISRETLDAEASKRSPPTLPRVLCRAADADVVSVVLA